MKRCAKGGISRGSPVVFGKDYGRSISRERTGDPLFSFHAPELGLLINEQSQHFIGVRMVPHDMRKISITWLFVMGVPLELAVMINVGWKDLNTAKDHYLHMRGLLKKSERKAYRDNIPEWYREGLDEYIEDREQ